MQTTINRPGLDNSSYSRYEHFKSFFDSNRTTAIWIELLRIQCEVNVREDLKFFFNSPSFQKAQSVLDFGCGPGDLIRTLKTYFPDKQYTGIDISEDYIKLAKKSFTKYKDIKFACDDIYTYKGPKFDYILSRQVVQHLTDNIKLLKCLKPLLSKNAHILTIDTVDALKKFSTPLPVMAQMYKDLAALQQKQGGNRRAFDIIEARCTEAGFNVKTSILSPVSAYTKDEKALMMKMFMFASEIVTRKFGVTVDQKKLHKELSAWRNKTGSYGQVGMKYLEIA